MGRDDAHRVSGLQGGRAPARAFAQYMQVAVARRPVEQFDSELTLPEWQLEPDYEAYFGEPDNGMSVDENVMPLESEPGTEPDMPAEPAEQTPETTPSPRLDQQWIYGVLGRETPPPPARKSILLGTRVSVRV